MNRDLLRSIPALLMAILVALPFMSSSATKRARADAERIMTTPDCSVPLQSGGSSTTFSIPDPAGVTQPLGFTGNVAACSLSIAYSWTFGQMDIVEWDPVSLAPDPSTVALRTRTFNPSDLSFNLTQTVFDPPIVLNQSGPLADPPRATVAINLQATYPYNPLLPFVTDSGAAVTPQAYSYGSNGVRTPIPGPHAVLGHAVCGADAALQSLAVVQSVMTTSAALGTGAFEIVQPFRVPREVSLHWVELAFAPQTTPYPFDPGTIAIYDAQGAGAPPETLSAPLVQAPFQVTAPYLGYALWASHFDFDHWVDLVPGHDYWLFVHTGGEYNVYAKNVTGSEGTNFTSSIGPLYQRGAVGVPWTSSSSQALSFRLIGQPAGTLEATLPPPRPGLRLNVTPNPSPAGARVAWLGATGSVRFDVFDARGRRVAGVEARPGATGGWTWNGKDDGGRALAAGVYFVRGTDDAGRAASERLVLIR
jgi:hypothetical protein